MIINLITSKGYDYLFHSDHLQVQCMLQRNLGNYCRNNLHDFFIREYTYSGYNF